MSSGRVLPRPDLEIALDYHRCGDLLQAEEAYRRVLAAQPDHAGALHLHGVVAHQLGRHEEALASIGRAIALQPHAATYHCNLGEAHRALGQLERAEACQRQALALDPKLAEAHSNLGLVLQAKGQSEGARSRYRRALELKPELTDAMINLGNLLADEGRVIQAVEHFERALELAPHDARAHYNLANALRAQDLLEPAIQHYRHALALDPGYAQAHNNLGLALLQQSRHAPAAAAFEAAIALDPDRAEAHNNLGMAWQAEGDLAAARASYERALALDAALAPAHRNLGIVQQVAGQRDAAIASFRRAVALDPEFGEAHHALGHLLKEQGRLAESIEAFERALEHDPDHGDATAQLVYQLMHACDWSRLRALGPRLDALTDTALAEGQRPGATPFGELGRCSNSARHAEIARAWARGIERRVAETGLRFAFPDRRRPKPRLRIGYLSCDFRDHPVAHQVTRLLELHDRARVEVHAYSYGSYAASAERERIAAACDRFSDLEALSDTDAARRIHQDGIDILVDLTGYTQGNRVQIAALRPAAVQVAWLGFLGTTGATFFDYLIADAVCVAEEEARWYTERLVRLPDCGLVFGEDERRDNRYRRSDFGLPEDGPVLVSMNAAYKIEADVFAVWMDLLKAVPGSVLWLYRSSDLMARNLRREAKASGVEPRRLVFADRVPYADHLMRLQLADLALDTRTYNGGLTSANALWAGVPVVTLSGHDMVSRMGASMLSALDLPELIAHDLKAYRQCALDLLRDRERLQALKERLESRRLGSPLFDTARFARHLESAYHAMWEVHARGEPPRALRIDALRP